MPRVHLDSTRIVRIVHGMGQKAGRSPVYTRKRCDLGGGDWRGVYTTSTFIVLHDVHVGGMIIYRAFSVAFPLIPMLYPNIGATPVAQFALDLYLIVRERTSCFAWCTAKRVGFWCIFLSFALFSVLYLNIEATSVPQFALEVYLILRERTSCVRGVPQNGRNVGVFILSFPLFPLLCLNIEATSVPQIALEVDLILRERTSFWRRTRM